MIGNNENQLNDDEAQMLEGEIIYEELTTALKNMEKFKKVLEMMVSQQFVFCFCLFFVCFLGWFGKKYP